VDQYYFEEGFIEASYFTYIAEAKIDFGPYIEADYLDYNYFLDNYVRASIACDLTEVVGVLVTASGTLDSNFALNSDVIRIRIVGITANTTASLSSDIAKILDAESTISSSILLISDVIRIRSGESAVSSSLTISTEPNIIRDFSASIASSISLTASLTSMNDIEMFAFSDAQLAAAVNLIRDSEIIASSTFSVAIDFVRQRDTGSDQDTVISAIIAGLRSRDVTSETQAAFSLTITVDRIRDVNIALQSAAQLTAQVQRSRDVTVFLTSSASLSALISNIRNIDLVAFTNAALSVEYIRIVSATANLNSEITQSIVYENFRPFASALQSDFVVTANADRLPGLAVTILSSLLNLTSQASRTRSITKTLTATATVFIRDKKTRGTVLTALSGGAYDTAQFINGTGKFGAASLSWNRLTDVYPTSNVVWNGTNYRTWGNGYVWTSTDLESWTRSASDQSVSGEVIYQNNLYVTAVGNTVYSSSNGTSWTATTVPTSRITLPVYNGGYWWYYNAVVRASDTDLQCYRSTSLTGTWTLQTVLFFGGGGYEQYSGLNYYVLSTGQVIFGVNGFIDDTFNNRYLSMTLVTGGTKTRYAEFAYGNVYSSGQIAAGGNTFLQSYVSGNVTKLRYGSTSVNNSSSEYDFGSRTVYNISYANGYYFISTNYGIYQTSNPSSGYTLVDQRLYFDHSISYSNDLSIDYANGKYFYPGFDPAVVRYSSNRITWSDGELDDVSGVTGQLTYIKGDGVDLGSFGTLDFWIYSVPSISANTLTVRQKDNLKYFYFNLNSTQVSINTLDSTNGLTSFVSSSISNTLISNTWNHIRFVYDGSTASLYTNGTRRLTTSSWIGNYTNADIIISGANDYIDEVLFTDEILTSPSSTSFTVPTAPWQNNNSTDLLLHFDTNANDDAVLQQPITHIGLAQLSSSSSISCILSKVVELESNQSSQFALIADGIILQLANATLTSSLTININSDRIRETNSLLNSNFVQSITFIKLINGESSLSASAIQSTQAVKTVDITKQLTATATIFCIISHIEGADMVAFSASTLSVDADANKSAISSMSSSASLTTSAQRFRGITETEQSLFSTTINAVKITDVISSQSSQFAITATPVEIVDINETYTAAFSLSYAIELIKQGSSSISSTASLTAIGANIVDATVAMTAFAVELTVSDKFSGGSSNLTLATTLGASGDRIRFGLSNVNSEFTQSVDASKTTFNVINLGIISEISCQILHIEGADLVAFTNATLTCDADAGKFAEASLSSTASISITVSKIVGFSSTQSAAFNQISTGQRIRYADSINQVSTTQTTQVNVIRSAVIDLDTAATIFCIISHIEGADMVAFTNATLTVSGKLFKGLSSIQTAAFSETADSSRIRGIESLNEAQFNITAVGNTAKLGNAGLISTFNIQAQGMRRINATVSISSAMSFIVSVREIDLDTLEQYIYMIPNDNRIYKIREETRIYINIKEKTRIYNIRR